MSGECENCHEHPIDCRCSTVRKNRTTETPRAKDPCQFCEKSEVLDMLIPELEKIKYLLKDIEFRLFKIESKLALKQKDC